RVLDELTRETRTIVMYEAPHRLIRTLEELSEVLGGTRRISLCRELTKKHETVNRMTIDEAVRYFTEQAPRGEFVLVIEGKDPKEIQKEQEDSWKEKTIEEHMAHYTDQGIDRKEAMKLVAKDRGCGKRDIYNYLVSH
ncbi:MAG: 16S rRNA (cytidine(1402)-2'-O)-methyltransferase, partial [Eubacterium sp.]|nr:16S rRNA (cytidine(1402)-2'-O)-methyltransferase [Eubacterium sp.]